MGSGLTALMRAKAQTTLAPSWLQARVQLHLALSQGIRRDRWQMGCREAPQVLNGPWRQVP